MLHIWRTRHMLYPENISRILRTRNHPTILRYNGNQDKLFSYKISGFQVIKVFIFKHRCMEQYMLTVWKIQILYCLQLFDDWLSRFTKNSESTDTFNLRQPRQFFDRYCCSTSHTFVRYTAEYFWTCHICTVKWV